MSKEELEIGDLVQLTPDHPKFPGFLVVVTEPKSFGCQGYLMSPYDLGDTVCSYKGRAFVRPKKEQYEHVGKMAWIFEDKEFDDN